MTLRLVLSRFNIARIASHRCVSTNTNTEYSIAVTDDGSTLVAWHPKTDFPYECTRPLSDKKIEENPSVLKTTMTPQVMDIFNKKSPEQARQELMNVTHTTKHRWFPRARDKRAKKTPMDRKYL